MCIGMPFIRRVGETNVYTYTYTYIHVQTVQTYNISVDRKASARARAHTNTHARRTGLCGRDHRRIPQHPADDRRTAAAAAVVVPCGRSSQSKRRRRRAFRYRVFAVTLYTRARVLIYIYYNTNARYGRRRANRPAEYALQTTLSRL